ncbi:MAG TPA: arginase family protein, partial [Alphaproteobacteria bacterium]|nr:arginase family protein [Alphaproteobacteria bacterium]
SDYKVMSFDTDSLWPADFTLATGTPVPGGIDPDAMLAALKALPRGCFDMIELVEVNPALGNISRTAELAIKLLEAAVL